MGDETLATNGKKQATFRGNTMVVVAADGGEPLAVTVPSLVRNPTATTVHSLLSSPSVGMILFTRDGTQANAKVK